MFKNTLKLQLGKVLTPALAAVESGQSELTVCSVSPSTEELYMYDVYVGFDTNDPWDWEIVQKVAARRKALRQGVNHDLVQHVMSTKTGREFVKMVAQRAEAGHGYSAEELAALLGPDWTKRKVLAKINVLGRPEGTHGARIFDRPSQGHFSLSIEMKDAILLATAV